MYRFIKITKLTWARYHVIVGEDETKQWDPLRKDVVMRHSAMPAPSEMNMISIFADKVHLAGLAAMIILEPVAVISRATHWLEMRSNFTHESLRASMTRFLHSAMLASPQ